MPQKVSKIGFTISSLAARLLLMEPGTENKTFLIRWSVLAHFALFLVCSFFLVENSVLADTFPWEDEPDAPSLHSQTFSLGASVGRVEGLGEGLSKLAGPDNGVIILEGIQNNYLTPYMSEELQIFLALVNNFNLVQGAYGRRWSTVPFPKTFLRPWIGTYITLNFLEDLRGNYDGTDEEEESDGIGIGLAAAFGVTMRIGDSFGLEAAAKGDLIYTAGWLDTGEFYKDEFRIAGAYLRLFYFFGM